MRRLTGNWRQRGLRIGFVPTMGCLHQGHVSLFERARRAVPKPGKVVASIYVNPTQFGLKEDFSKYPRNLRADSECSARADVDVLFVPSDAEIYPGSSDQPFSTFVTENCVSRGMEGDARPGHFRGVCTVLAKLFNIVAPDIVVFGRKDFQQSVVVRRMARDLNFPLKLVTAPTIRDSDGLAMSSRNRYLPPSEREQATILYAAIRAAREAVRNARSKIPGGRLRRRLIRLIEKQPAVRVDYIAFFDPKSLRPVDRVGRGTHCAVAAFVGKTRLIDNGRL